MFTRFSELPADLRRKIWLATLGPMTLTFTGQEPPEDEVMRDISELDLTGLPQEEVDYYLRPPLFLNFTRYYGHVALPDGTSQMLFTVKSSAAYLACKESREFLRFVFAEPPRPSGGLPSWFRFDIDTIRVKDICLPILAQHDWFVQTQNLMIAIIYEIEDYMGFQTDGYYDTEGKDHDWVRQNLTSLRDLTFEMMFARTYDKGGSHWLHPWFSIFEEWYNSKFEDDPPPFWTRVISYQEGTSEDEWLTPDNYLLLNKMVLRKHIEKHAPRTKNLRRYLMKQREISIYEASDDELRNPAKFLEKNRPMWD